MIYTPERDDKHLQPFHMREPSPPPPLFAGIVAYVKMPRAVVNTFYCIAQLVHALWLTKLAGRILLYGSLKIKAVFVANIFRDLSPSVFNFYWK